MTKLKYMFANGKSRFSKRKYTRFYNTIRSDKVSTHEFINSNGLISTYGMAYPRELPANARNLLKKGDIVGVDFIDNENKEWYRYIEILNYSGNRMIGKIVDWYDKIKTNDITEQKRWTCNECNFDLCEKCYPGHTHPHILKEGTAPPKNDKFRSYYCDGDRCTKLHEGRIVTFHRTGIHTIYNFTKNGKKIYKMFQSRRY